MTVAFYDQDAPNTVANFLKLAESGFYNNVTFHRVIPNFVVQGGDPTGTGAGGPGYKIDCELDGENQYHDRGVLSMAHAVRKKASPYSSGLILSIILIAFFSDSFMVAITDFSRLANRLYCVICALVSMPSTAYLSYILAMSTRTLSKASRMTAATCFS